MSVSSRVETLSTTAELLESGVAEGKVILLRDASADIYLGGSAVTGAANGFKLATTDVLSLTLLQGDELYAVAAAGTPTVAILVTRDNS